MLKTPSILNFLGTEHMPAPDLPHAFFAEPPAAISPECQQRAAECLRLVRTSLDSTNKALLLEMAQAWIRLAEQSADTSR